MSDEGVVSMGYGNGDDNGGFAGCSGPECT